MAALAVGLAFAERSGEETIDCLIDLAGGRIADLAAARQRIQTLDGLDPHVIDRAVSMTEAALRTQHRRCRTQLEVAAHS